jgi:outer membrane protein assembly factor BamB
VARVLIILGVLAILFVAGYSVLQKSNLIPNFNQSSIGSSWSQFHGNYLHAGYADVKGPGKANLKWKYQLGKREGGDPNSVVVSSDGTIYVAGASEIFALDKNGKKIWSKSYQSTQGPAVTEDGIVYFLSKDTIVALDNNGEEKWQFKTNGATAFGPTIGPDGTIYQGSWDSYFYAINKDGTLKWKYKTAGTISYPASIDKNGIIYLGGGDAHAGPDGNLYAFSSNGTLKWKYDTKTLRVGSPAIGPDGLIYVAAAPNLFVFDSSGTLKWKMGSQVDPGNVQAAETTGCGAPPLPACNGMGQPQNGSTQPSTGCGAPPLPPCNGVGSQNGNMPQPEDSGSIAGIITPAIASSGTIYIGNPQGVLSAIDPKTQEIKWTYKTGADSNQPGFYGLPSFPVVDNEGSVYFGSVDGKMYAVNKDGKLLWEYQTDGRITEASPAFGSDGTLYFTSMDGYLYAIGN